MNIQIGPQFRLPAVDAKRLGKALSTLGSGLLCLFSKMAARASQTRVKEEVERSIEKLEREQLRGLQVS